MKAPPEPARPGVAPSPPAPVPDAADTFWEPDHPEQKPDGAFGTLTPIRNIPVVMDGKPLTFEIQHFTLDAPLPAVPERLPVYMAGSYPVTRSTPLLRDQGWQYTAAFSLVLYRGDPLTPPAGEDPATRAAALLKQYRLLMADSHQPTLMTLPDGSSKVAFFRHIGGIPVYGDKPACVRVDADGQVPWLQIRRRPLVDVSMYPTVSPQEAWKRLQTKQYTKPSSDLCQDGGTDLVGEVAEFRVKSVELAYWEPHADEDRMVMMPYYVFRDEKGHTLYVPAVVSSPIPHPAPSVRESTLTATLRSSAGKKVHVYLYASDERVETIVIPSCMASFADTVRSGHYTFYSEVEGEAVLRPQEVTPFESTLLSFNDRRPNYIEVVPGSPDLLVVRQYGACNGDLIAVLAPSSDGTRLVAYRFQSGDGQITKTTTARSIAYPQPGMIQTSASSNATGTETTTTWEIRPAEGLLVAVKTEVR